MLTFVSACSPVSVQVQGVPEAGPALSPDGGRLHGSAAGQQDGVEGAAAQLHGQRLPRVGSVRQGSAPPPGGLQHRGEIVSRSVSRDVAASEWVLCECVCALGVCVWGGGGGGGGIVWVVLSAAMSATVTVCLCLSVCLFPSISLSLSPSLSLSLSASVSVCLSVSHLLSLSLPLSLSPLLPSAPLSSLLSLPL